MDVKTALDNLFEGVDFDASLHNKLLVNNIEFITRNQEYTKLFGGRNIGCYFIKYTMYDKNIFYDNLFGLQYDEVVDAISDINTVPASFKIARDDINLVTFYIAHRFLSNDKLSDKQKTLYASEALNYFSYRTLVLISSTYFVYPISEAKATSLTERLSAKYVIKNVRNWSEYCHYRSEEYLKSRFRDIVTTFDKDKELPNAITDLFGRTKDTLKNIYGEFMSMLEKDEILASRTSTITNLEGKESIADRVESISKYISGIDNLLTDRNTLIKKTHIAVVADILPTLSQKALEEALSFIIDYAYLDKTSYVKISDWMKEILGNAVEYLQRNDLSINSKSDPVQLVNSLVGNILYARGVNVSVHQLKQKSDRLIKQIYKQFKVKLNDRTTANIRNGVYIYIVLSAVTT